MNRIDDDPPPLISNDEDNDEDFEEEETTFIEEPCLDLFSDKVFKSANECLDYCKETHGFDIKVIKKQFDLDCFSFIRLINYIRKEKPAANLLVNTKSKPWMKDDYLKPVMEDDPLLMYDIEEDEDENEVNEDDLNSIQHLKKELDEMRIKAELLEQALGDVENMRQLTKSLIEGNQDDKVVKTKDVASCIQANEDGGYAGSYAHFSIHHEMLSDKVRTEAYRDAVYDSPDQIKDKQVLDLGCGTGILSMFCAKAGAANVTAVDMSDIIHNTNDIIRENQLEHKIKLIKGRLEDVQELQGKKFDVLISEWMGYFLLYEGMLDSVISARDKYLSPGGLILPNHCLMHLFAISDQDRYDKTVDFWKDVYGFKMSCMKDPVLTEASVEVVPSDKVKSGLAQILELDLTKCTIEDFASFQSDFELKISENCNITAIGGSFDTIFAQMLTNPVNLSTSPHTPPTHWKQTVFYLEKPIKAQKDEILKGKISVSRPPKDARGLLVKLEIGGQSRIYDMA